MAIGDATRISVCGSFPTAARTFSGARMESLKWIFTGGWGPRTSIPPMTREIRARRVFTDVAGRQTPAFCPEDLLAYLCVNGAKNGWNSLAGICDLDRLIDVCRLDWGAILSRAARRRMSRIVPLGACL